VKRVHWLHFAAGIREPQIPIEGFAPRVAHLRRRLVSEEENAMQRQKWLILIVFLTPLAVGAALAGVAWVAWSRYQDRIGCVSRLNFDRIEEGMSLEEVEALLGSPGEELATIPHTIDLADADDYGRGRERNLVPGQKCFLWNDSHLKIWVGFAKGRVAGKELSAYAVPEYTPPDLRRLRMQKRPPF
jgi:hypothetical protein